MYIFNAPFLIPNYLYYKFASSEAFGIRVESPPRRRPQAPGGRPRPGRPWPWRRLCPAALSPGPEAWAAALDRPRRPALKLNSTYFYF